jgi:uncharacterized repeat protein (TIGR03803 family)
MPSSKFCQLSSLSLAIALTFTPVAFLATHVSAQTESVIYSFKGATDGAGPYGGLIADQDGNLYGTTSEGGGAYLYGYGTVFELSPSAGGWTETVIHSFHESDGCYPQKGLVMDAQGNLYGTAYCGGSHGSGVVFELQRLAGGQWNEITLHDFYFDGMSHFDGSNPSSTLIFDSEGNLYGTTEFGGIGRCVNLEDTRTRSPKYIPPSGCGTVFELSPNSDGTWTETLLYIFKGDTDGGLPLTGLTFDSAGNLYGTATNGGSYESGLCGSFYDLGAGVVFSLSRGADGAWTENVLYTFNGSDGGVPTGTLIFDHAGNLYGTTAGCGGWYFHNSTAFELSPSSGGTWTRNTIHGFGAGTGDPTPNGYSPWGGMTFDSAGNLYGTTYYSADGRGFGPGGVVFKLTEAGGSWSESVVHSFGSAPDGAYPAYDDLLLKDGVLYGTTSKGGSFNFGTVFAVTP